MNLFCGETNLIKEKMFPTTEYSNKYLYGTCLS